MEEKVEDRRRNNFVRSYSLTQSIRRSWNRIQRQRQLRSNPTHHVMPDEPSESAVKWLEDLKNEARNSMDIPYADEDTCENDDLPNINKDDIPEESITAETIVVQVTDNRVALNFRSESCDSSVRGPGCVSPRKSPSEAFSLRSISMNESTKGVDGGKDETTGSDGTEPMIRKLIPANIPKLFRQKASRNTEIEEKEDLHFPSWYQSGTGAMSMKRSSTFPASSQVSPGSHQQPIKETIIEQAESKGAFRPRNSVKKNVIQRLQKSIKGLTPPIITPLESMTSSGSGLASPKNTGGADGGGGNATTPSKGASASSSRSTEHDIRSLARLSIDTGISIGSSFHSGLMRRSQSHHSPETLSPSSCTGTRDSSSHSLRSTSSTSISDKKTQKLRRRVSFDDASIEEIFHQKLSSFSIKKVSPSERKLERSKSELGDIASAQIAAKLMRKQAGKDPKKKKMMKEWSKTYEGMCVRAQKLEQAIECANQEDLQVKPIHQLKAEPDDAKGKKKKKKKKEFHTGSFFSLISMGSCETVTSEHLDENSETRSRLSQTNSLEISSIGSMSGEEGESCRINNEDTLGPREDSLDLREDSLDLREDSLDLREDSFDQREDSIDPGDDKLESDTEMDKTQEAPCDTISCGCEETLPEDNEELDSDNDLEDRNDDLDIQEDSKEAKAGEQNKS